jgi:hypothetical protein
MCSVAQFLLLLLLLLLQVDPFDKNSPIKQAAIEKFPPDMFFVLRVVQLLRGMANGEELSYQLESIVVYLSLVLCCWGMVNSGV